MDSSALRLEIILIRAISHKALVSADGTQVVIATTDLHFIICAHPQLSAISQTVVHRRVSAFLKKYCVVDQVISIELIPAAFASLDVPLQQALWLNVKQNIEKLLPRRAPVEMAPRQMSMEVHQCIVVASDDEVEAPETQVCLASPPCAYLSWPCVELVHYCQTQDEQVESLRKQIKLLQQKVRRQSDTIVAVRASQSQKSAEMGPLVVHHKSGAHFSSRDAFNVAIRRNFSHVSTDTLGSVILQEMSHQSVSRCEYKLGLALLAHAKIWHNMQEWSLAQRAAEAAFDVNKKDLNVILSFHRVRGDATNSGAWQKLKLYNTEYMAAYLTCFDSLLSGDWEHAFVTFVQYADLQIVTDQTTAGILGIRDKQLSALGAPLPWVRVNPEGRSG
jgi:hypothetical protein